MRWTTKQGSNANKVNISCLNCHKPMLCYQSSIRKYCSYSCRSTSPGYLATMSNSGKKRAALGLTGKDNPNWRGGVTSERNRLMSTQAYKQWRKAVYERDNYTCTQCGAKGTGKNLNADHIKPFSLFPELRLEVSNGRTLCIECHKNTDTYGWKLFNQTRSLQNA